MNRKTEIKQIELNVLLTITRHLTDKYLHIEALKDSPEISKTKAQTAIWKCLNILGKAEIELDNEIEKETK